jgi:tetratricopeptide (TPR) repeat protein
VRSRWGVVVLGLLLWAAAVAVPPADAADARSIAGLDRSLAIAESRIGPTSPHLLPLLDRLAGAQIDDGELVDASSSRRRALRIALRSYGGESTKTANAMVALADVELLRHRYTEAEPLLITALSILEAGTGSDSSAVTGVLAALARIALARGDLPAAQSWADRANAASLRHPSNASSEALRVLGAVYSTGNRFDDGERVLRTALARDRQAHGDNNVETARSLAQLANLLLRAQRFNEALPLIEQAIAIDQQRLAPTHPLIADDYADLGLIYAGLGRDDAAGDAIYYALDLLDRGSSEETPRVAYLELQLAPVLRRLGEPDDAQDAFDDAKRILDAAAEDEKKHERQL